MTRWRVARWVATFAYVTLTRWATSAWSTLGVDEPAVLPIRSVACDSKVLGRTRLATIAATTDRIVTRSTTGKRRRMTASWARSTWIPLQDVGREYTGVRSRAPCGGPVRVASAPHGSRALDAGRPGRGTSVRDGPPGTAQEGPRPETPGVRPPRDHLAVAGSSAAVDDDPSRRPPD